MTQHIGFRLNASEYTVPILEVQEIINLPAITKIPQAPHYVEGVTNLRGRIVPILDLKRLINVPGNGKKNDKVIVIASGKRVFGILIDSITGVVNIDESTIEPCDDFSRGGVDQIQGVARLSDRLVVLLNTRKIIPGDYVDVLDSYLEVKEIDEGSKVEVTKTVQTMAGEMRLKEVIDARDFFEKSGVSSQDQKYLILEDIVKFMEAINRQDLDEAEQALQLILGRGQDSLFKEVGKVTRKLHDSILSFKESLDPRLREITENEMPGVVERLNYVIDKTKEAADNTMGIAEKYLLRMDDLSTQIRGLEGPQAQVDYIKNFKDSLEDDLIKIITAQSFQDLTGQTIKKVITLVSEIEEELVRVIKTFGIKVDKTREEQFVADKVSQSEVDDLLKTLGF